MKIHPVVTEVSGDIDIERSAVPAIDTGCNVNIINRAGKGIIETSAVMIFLKSFSPILINFRREHYISISVIIRLPFLFDLYELGFSIQMNKTMSSSTVILKIIKIFC